MVFLVELLGFAVGPFRVNIKGFDKHSRDIIVSCISRVVMTISFRKAEKFESVICTYQGRRYPHTAKGERRKLIGVGVTFDRCTGECMTRMY